MLEKYYIYRHIRSDNNTPFYIGRGTKPKQIKGFRHEYKRAFDTSSKKRSPYWINVYEKNNKDIEVEILYESDDINEIEQKEIEFISLYGRSDLDKGTLVNLTNGGKGPSEKIVKPETRNLIANSIKGRKHSEETKRKIALNNARHNKGVPQSEEMKIRISNTLKAHFARTGRKVKCIETGEVFNSAREANIKMFGVPRNSVHKVLSKKNPHKSYKGFHFCYDGEDETIKYPSNFKRIFCSETSRHYISVVEFCRVEFNDTNRNLRSRVYRSLKMGIKFDDFTLTLVK